MGTNYYIEKNCDGCGHTTRKHIGKSSAGWYFALHIYPEEGIATLEDWERLWKDGRIVDEYGDAITAREMSCIIRHRGAECGPHRVHEQSERFHAENHSEPGLYGLLRSKISSASLCVSHGEGTWDCFEREIT